jgi:hypothetical protein
MNTCKTCKWWGKWEPTICDKVTHDFGKPNTQFELIIHADDDSNLWGALKTGPDFGCIHHEEK